MKPRLIFTALLLSFYMFIVSCGGKDKKEGDTNDPKTETTVKENNGDGMVPAIDTANLKDEASILDAMQKVSGCPER